MPPHSIPSKPGAGISTTSATKPANLTCSHCQGHLVADLYFDRVDSAGHVWIRVRRCVRCGHIEEAGQGGLASLIQGRKSLRKQEGTSQEGLDDEIIVLGT